MSTPEKKSHVNLNNAKRPGDTKYRSVIQQIENDKVCPFCIEHLLKYHKKPILKQGKFWVVTTNMYPYKNAKFHFLFIHKEHVTDTENMSPESFAELHQHINWLIKENNISGGTLMMRCGNTAETGATVTHIHAHFIVADFNNPNREEILARVG